MLFTTHLLFLFIQFAYGQYPPPQINDSQVGIDTGYHGPLESCSCAEDRPRIKWITFGTNTSYAQDGGDTFYSTWGPDWDTWFTIDDSAGIKASCSPNGSNIIINKARGPSVADLRPATVNCLQKEWGLHGDDMGHGDDGSWKTTGLSWLDDVLYLWVSRNFAPAAGNNSLRQTAQNSCLLKSLNYGVTFQGPDDEECYTNPTFPGRLFGTPSFIQYGRNGEAGPHGSDKYAYAISNDGSWDNGDSIQLGRVPRERIANLSSKDWEFFNGSPSEVSWTRNLSDAKPLLYSQNQLSSTAAIYNPYLEEYILNEWYFPNRTGYGVYPQALYPTVWTWYASRKPWGPYRVVSNTSWPNAAWYNPSVLNKFWGFDGKSGTVITSGHAYLNHSSQVLSTIPFEIETFW
ncbi:hypothetical protein NA57DRAFT_72833 [Rhizodiscina lignyota]|uniref:Uncharacterized protein n=1 Tax=Rhizodiscina lignyota TaxID=1504668 RepID=A0A9P4IL43_9PEZI|nr:hypothetical protein NA57DRAFT_72833 [Rhizodiscina lignyota]